MPNGVVKLAHGILLQIAKAAQGQTTLPFQLAQSVFGVAAVQQGLVQVKCFKALGLKRFFFLAGLQSIPKSVLEAAAIDGAGAFRRFRHVTLPLLGPRDLSQPLCWRAGQAISAAQFIAEAQVLATGLPVGRPVNLCQDRYLFALGLAAALMRGQTSLMPPNALAETLAGLGSDDARTYALVDSIIRRQEYPLNMPAMDGEPSVNAHLVDLHAYLSARAYGTQGPGRPER